MKIINLSIIIMTALLLSACNINMGEVGNGNLVTQDRKISEDFTEVKASAGLDVYLTQGQENKVVVESDENLQRHIEARVLNGVLKVGTRKNIRRSKATKVYITFKNLDKIEASSGADIQGNSIIKSQSLSLKASSGAEIELEVFSQDLTMKASSGGDLKIIGKATSLTVNASSGSEINAKELMVLNCIAKASSGAKISISVKEKIDAKASSGGEINYFGNPTMTSTDKTSSGSVKKR